MALIVETGAGLENAESYVSTAEALTYHDLMGNCQWVTSGTFTTVMQEQALRRAAAYMAQTYYGGWSGYRLTATQALDWPRSGFTVDGYYVTSGVPQAIKNAQMELALKAAQGDLSPDLSQGVLKKQVDVISIEYDKSSPQRVRYVSVDGMLSPYLSGGGRGASTRLVRT